MSTISRVSGRSAATSAADSRRGRSRRPAWSSRLAQPRANSGSFQIAETCSPCTVICVVLSGPDLGGCEQRGGGAVLGGDLDDLRVVPDPQPPAGGHDLAVEVHGGVAADR